MFLNSEKCQGWDFYCFCVIKGKPTGDGELVSPHTRNQFYNILRLFDILPNFPWPQVKRCPIITYKHGIYELRNDLKLRILEK